MLVSAYKDMAQRLEKMERLISDFAIDPNNIDSTSPPSVTEDSPLVGSPDNKLSKISTHPILQSIEKSDFEWVNDWSPFEDRALRGGKVREPYREDRFIPQLWPDGTQSGHTGKENYASDQTNIRAAPANTQRLPIPILAGWYSVRQSSCGR